MRSSLVTLTIVMSFHMASTAKWHLRTDYNNPWGNIVNWVDMDEAYEIGKRTDVPTMLIIWRKGCPGCEVLQNGLRYNREFHIASRYFSMVEAEVPLHPFTKHQKFDLDGQYIPRIFFLDGDGHIMKEYDNKGRNRNFKYYHDDPRVIPGIMRQVKEDYAYGVHREL